jgi:drug/metabolite transporter, DME family
MITGYLYILTAAVSWGFIGIFSGIAFSQGLMPMEVAFWRAILAWLCFGGQAFYRSQTRVDVKDLPILAFFAVFGITVFYIAYQYAVKTGGAAFAAVLLYTAPAWVVAFSFVLYKERLTGVKVGAVVLVMAGVYLISRTGNASGSTTIGPLALISGLVSGLCYSLYYTMGKYFSRKYSSANLFLYVLPLGALGILPFVDFVDKTPLAWAALIGVAVISTFLANYCYYNGLKHLEAGRASIVATIEPVVAAIAAFLVFGEYFTMLGYLGAVCILVAVIATIAEK